MSKYYRGKRKNNIYDPSSPKPFRLSRTKVDLFVTCPRCFYLDRRLGVDRPPSFPFALNSAVDALLKKEFDGYRANKEPHPIMKAHNIDAVPFHNERLEEWRDALRRGVSYLHTLTNFIITGGIDDVWINRSGELHVVDYKATAKSSEVTIDEDWQAGYRRQAEFYQWLFRRNGFKVSNRAYFVYCNGDLKASSFDSKLCFEIKVIPYDGNDSWVEKAIIAAHECLKSDKFPNSNPDCDFCLYRKSVGDVLRMNPSTVN